jgi:RNA polymerase sigma-70 factor, ECF subfamily
LRNLLVIESLGAAEHPEFSFKKHDERGRYSLMDESRFEAIYAKQSRPLWLYISRMAGSSGVADDLLQETFLKFLQKPLEEEDSRVKSYLYKIATNQAYDYFRRTKSENKWQFQTEQDAEVEPAQIATAEGREMMRVFHGLKYQERALLWLAYIEGYGHR